MTQTADFGTTYPKVPGFGGYPQQALLHERPEGARMQNRNVACHLHCLPSQVTSFLVSYLRGFFCMLYVNLLFLYKDLVPLLNI